jgi:photosystem II stability/assembly factor-like uncharacterized protein
VNDFHSFFFDGSEGTCTDIFFFNQNTGVVSGAVFDGTGAIARTTDGGMNWSTLIFDQAIQGINFPKPTSGFAAGAGGRISHSNDAGISWTDQSSGTTVNLNDVCFASDALRGIAVGDSGTILWTANGGQPGPTPTPSATPTATPIATPRPTPTPRARPTPPQRPTNGFINTKVKSPEA